MVTSEKHSRFDPDHYTKCTDCQKDNDDFLSDQLADAQADADAEQSELGDEY
jgi:hypothetical protein